MKKLGLICIGVLMLLGAADPRKKEQPKADMVLRHGKIYTMNAARSWAESVAVQDGRFVYVGDDQGIDSWIGPNTQTIELSGRFVLPSFIDSHVHPVEAGIALNQCSLHEAGTKEEILQAVKQYSDSHPDLPWIIGEGWLPPIFPDANPQKEWLDAIVPDRPVILWETGGHFVWVNSKALQIANVTKQTPDPENGRIERDKNGEPSGTLRESAADLVSKFVPSPTMEEAVSGLRKAIAIMNQFGITGLQDANTSIAVEGARSGKRGGLDVYRQTEDSGFLTMRVIGALYADPQEPIDQIKTMVESRKNYNGKLFQATSVKIFADGVIEGGTAAVLEPYLDKKNNDNGILNWSPEKLNPFVEELDRQKFQLHFHALGDRAIRVALSALEAARERNGARDARPILAHLELIHPNDIPRFVRLGAIPCPQPLWAYEDSYIRDLYTPKLGSARMRWVHVIRSLADTGATLAFGSDWNVTSVNPLDGIEVAVTRQDPDDDKSSPFYPEERISLEAALAAYTIGSAYANFWEKETGSIETGKSADLIILSENLFEIPPARINETKVLLTLFEGKIIYRPE